MGWKAIRDHYRVRHHMHVSDKGICIGSGYIPEILIVSLEGELIKRYDDRGNDDLSRYQAEMLADPAKLRELALVQDTFEVATPVFTFDGGRVIEQHCEVFGWPNTTHDGSLMYENTHYLNKPVAAARAKSNAASAVRWRKDAIQRAEAELARMREDLAQAEADVAQLETDYPDVRAEANP